MSSLRLTAMATLVVAALSTACGDDFDPYEELTGLRLLAVSATPPDLVQGERATLQALVVPPTRTSTVTQRWFWCPFTESVSTGLRCALSGEDVEALVSGAGGDPTALPPFVPGKGFDLGADATAQLDYDFPSQVLEGLCAQIGSNDLPDAVELPACDGRFPIAVRVEVESEGRVVLGATSVDFFYEPPGPTDRNAHPAVESLEISGPGLAGLVRVAPTGTATVAADETYDLLADISDDAVEVYDRADPTQPGRTEPTSEILALTWFIPGGSLDRVRTSFIEGEVSLREAESNEWTTPLRADFEAGPAEIIIVIRDDRRGVSWIRGSVVLGGDS